MLCVGLCVCACGCVYMSVRWEVMSSFKWLKLCRQKAFFSPPNTKYHPLHSLREFIHMPAVELLLNTIISIQYVCTCYSMSFNTPFVFCIAPLNLSREFVYLCIHFIAAPPACEGHIRDGCDRCKMSFSSAMKTRLK